MRVYNCNIIQLFMKPPTKRIVSLLHHSSLYGEASCESYNKIWKFYASRHPNGQDYHISESPTAFADVKS